MRYLNGTTIAMALCTQSSYTISKCIGYSDADWAGDQLITWSSDKEARQ